ncbi:GNAT family N-acetyltransferase [Corynebacterium sp. CNCTC7651]|uniref:GNAT family N-acetyltransferase n=1 Tax=Corynebacterium sp. CNCTC7651 TaxID=2815361 RepID=UPI001F2C3595|nr:GNAT family N-acetyltransferase [Corynebacterium sp. CNCTC7651]
MTADNVLQPPRRLEKSDNRKDFSSGEPSLDIWFHRYAMQNQRARNCVVYVSTWNDRVMGYYAVCTGSVEKELAPEDFASGRPRAIPVVILARLAVDQRAQGKGIGRALLRDALTRCLAGSEAIGAAAVVVHALNEEAKQFYLSAADFIELPGEPLHLMLPIAQIARALQE